jgi:hypothetical protein
VPVGIIRPIAVISISLSLILGKAPAVGRSSKSKARASHQPCRSCQKHCEGNVYIRADMLPVFRVPMRSPPSGATLLPRYRSMEPKNRLDAARGEEGGRAEVMLAVAFVDEMQPDRHAPSDVSAQGQRKNSIAEP